jgi:hypothetical protein
MSLKDKLAQATGTKVGTELYDRFGVIENPYPSSGQTSDNPHLASPIDDEIDDRIASFVRDAKSQVVVVVGTQGTGKTNILNYYERQLKDLLGDGEGFYVVRYLADPEASFDSTLRRLFQELGPEHLRNLGEALSKDDSPIENARSHEVRVALRALAESQGSDQVVSALNEWLLGLRVLKLHRETLGVNFRLDTVESKTAALRDLVQVSSDAKLLKGIFLLLDELEKQDGVLSATAVVRYLSAMRAIIDALPNHLFMMIAVTPDALRRYSNALPAFRSRLENRVELQPLHSTDEALALAAFYLDDARTRAEKSRGSMKATFAPILSDEAIHETFERLFANAQRRGDEGLRQREFLHALHTQAEDAIQKVGT